MPKHYAVAENVQHYTIKFNNAKTVEVVFEKAFLQPPMVQVTPGDSGIFPLYKTNITKTSCKIRCKTAWSGEVDIVVLQRF